MSNGILFIVDKDSDLWEMCVCEGGGEGGGGGGAGGDGGGGELNQTWDH